MENKENQRDGLLKRIKDSTNSVRAMLVVFFVLPLGFRIFLGTPFSDRLFVLVVSWFILSFPFFFFTKQARTLSSINNIHLGWIICELILLTMIIREIGGIAWLGPFFYLFFAIYETFLFAEKQRTIMFFCTIASFLSLILLEYFGIISYHQIFPALLNVSKNPEYFFSTVSVELGMIIFSFVAIGIFRGELEKRIQQVTVAYKELEEIKNTLAVRVKAKTKALEEEKASLEQKVGQRTKELQEKLEELEQFHKLTVERELKMVEVKKEIAKLKKELEEYKK